MSDLTIYKCHEIITLMEEAAAQNDGEVPDDQLQALVEAQTTLPVKLENLCGFVKYLEHGIDACEKEEKRISKMRKVAANRIANIKKFLLPFMLKRKKMTLGTFQLSTRKSTSTVLDDEFNIPKYMKITLTPMKTKIKEDLLKGDKIMGATLVTKVSVQLK